MPSEPKMPIIQIMAFCMPARPATALLSWVILSPRFALTASIFVSSLSNFSSIFALSESAFASIFASSVANFLSTARISCAAFLR